MKKMIFQEKQVIRVFILLFFCIFVNADTWNDGASFGRDFRGHYGSNIKSTMVEPLTQGAEFKTKDGTQSFNANLTCSNEPSILFEAGYEIVSRNNIIPFVNFDKNLSGNIVSFISPYTAQGVCSNGIVVCDNNSNFNSSSDCKFYSWKLVGDEIQLVSSGRNIMQNCICTNDSCDSPSVNNRAMLLNMIGGGIYGALSEEARDVVVSEEPISGAKIIYMGQKISNCNTTTGSLPNLYPGKNDIDSSEQIVIQSNDEKSAYSSLLGASGNYSSTSSSVSASVSSTVSSSATTRSTLQHTDGTTKFKTYGQSGNAIDGNVNVKLDVDNLEYCQVEWDINTPFVYGDDTERTSSTNSGNTIQVETRECVNSVCPYQPSIGERIKHDCGQINNFSQVTSGMMAVQEMAGDITCGSI